MALGQVGLQAEARGVHGDSFCEVEDGFDVELVFPFGVAVELGQGHGFADFVEVLLVGDLVDGCHVPQALFAQVIPDVYRHEHGDLFNIECGFRVSQPFAPSSQVVSSHTPAGLTATTAHDRPYTQLPATHSALRQWAVAQGKSLAGVSWEIYDRWTPEAPEPRLEIFYLLRE